jgi:hypothetical protein
MTDTPVPPAERLKQQLFEISPLIEEYTAGICPLCVEVCCRQKHGLYQPQDIAYLLVVGAPVPQRDGSRPLDGPCEAMGPRGCVHPRWMRPFRCTWYYCEPLLAALNAGPQKKARKLNKLMQELIDLYREIPCHASPLSRNNGR